MEVTSTRSIINIFMCMVMSGILRVEIKGSEIKNIIFQSTLLTDGKSTVSCYGECDKDPSKFNVSYCLGTKVKFRCNHGYSIEIREATLGHLRADLDMCIHGKSLTCTDDVSSTIDSMCTGSYLCTVDVGSDLTYSKCRKTSPVLVVKYICSAKPSLATKVTSSKTFRTSVSKTFWSATAYFAISDIEAIRKNRTQLILVVLVSMFIGTVLSLCFCFDYCRKIKRKREQELLKTTTSVEIKPDTSGESTECVEGIKPHMVEIIKPKMMEIITLNGSLPRHKIVTRGNDGKNMELYDRREMCSSGLSTTPFVMKQKVNENTPCNKEGDKDQERSVSPSTLPPPPYDLLVDTSSSSSNELLPPPAGFKGDNSIPYLIVTNPSPPGGSTNSLMTSSKDVPQDRCNTEITNDNQESTSEGLNSLRSDVLKYEANDDTQCRVDDIIPYQASDESLSSPCMHRPMTHHRPDNPTVKCSSTSRSVTSNEDTSQEDTMTRNIESKRMRSRKCNSKEKAGFQKSKGLEIPKKKNSNNQGLPRNPRKGKVNATRRYEDETLHRVNKTTHSDNELSKRRRYNISNKRSCSYHEHAALLSSAQYCITCGDSNESHLIGSNCLPTRNHEFDDNQSSQTTTTDDLKKSQQHVEESGYQTHDTGTDSLCSSPFSTDQEDSRMFLPAYLKTSCRASICRNCEYNKRESHALLSRDHNNTTQSRGFHRFNRTNSDACYTSTDAHPFGSPTGNQDLLRVDKKTYLGDLAQSGLTDIDESSNRNRIYEIGIGGFETS